MPSSRADREALSPRAWLLGHALALACTAPPRPQPGPEVDPGPPPPPPTVVVTVDAPGLSAADVEAQVAAPLEAALARVPAVTALTSRLDDDRATITATVTSPAALTAIRDALAAAQTHLPHSTDLPVIHRGNPEPAALVLTIVDMPDAADLARERLVRVSGVARVDVCGGASAALTITLDPRRLADLATDDVLRALEDPLRAPLFGDHPALTFDDLRALPLRSDRTLRDVATVARTATPRPCANFLDDDVALLVVPQAGADPARVAADARAAVRDVVPARLLAVPAEADLLAVLDLELAPTAPDAVETCLRRLPAVTDLALVRPDEASEPAPQAPPAPADPAAPVHARLYLAARPEPPPAPPTANPAPAPTFPIGPVRETLSACAGVRRAAVVAPLAVADHPLTVEVLGPDPAALARVADQAAALLRGLPGVTLARVHAPRERPAREMTLTPALDAFFPSGRPTTIPTVVRLAVGPLELGRLDGLPVRLDLFDRPGAIEQVLPLLTVAAENGPVPLSSFARLDVAPSTLVPRYRVDQQPAALVELRLRRAADRETVTSALQTLERPPGLQVRLGPALALRRP